MNMAKKSDEALALLMQKEGEGIEAIIDRYQEKLRRYVGGIVKDEDKVEDVIQETFIAVYRNINSFDLNRKFSSWIYRIAHNKAINEIRKNSIFTSLEILKEVADETEESKSFEKNFDAKKTKEMVLSKVESLPLKYREVLLLRYFEDKTYEEISDILTMPKNTVGVRINRGLELLKRNMNINLEDYL